jgi:fructosamine-3-kinase
MPISADLTTHLCDKLSEHSGRSLQIHEAVTVGGGSINDAYRLVTTAGSYFVKTNSADRFPSMFEAEADGLARLRNTRSIRTPEVIAVGEFEDTSYLLLELIEQGDRDLDFWGRFGEELADLHRNSSPRFGLERPNYIGTLPQVNTEELDWATFMVQHRLEPMVKMGRDGKKVDAGMAFRFERLYGKLADLFPKEPPALLHGDLWQGNFLCSEAGQPVLVDPAVYYGHREMDLAMARLFGGFEASFHRSYQEAWPLEKGWEARVDLCNLYPLLVHVNLFGGSYAQQVDGILKRFV